MFLKRFFLRSGLVNEIRHYLVLLVETLSTQPAPGEAFIPRLLMDSVSLPSLIFSPGSFVMAARNPTISYRHRTPGVSARDASNQTDRSTFSHRHRREYKRKEAHAFWLSSNLVPTTPSPSVIKAPSFLPLSLSSLCVHKVQPSMQADGRPN
jgi:hypothetical protein